MPTRSPMSREILFDSTFHPVCGLVFRTASSNDFRSSPDPWNRDHGSHFGCGSCVRRHCGDDALDHYDHGDAKTVAKSKKTTAMSCNSISSSLPGTSPRKIESSRLNYFVEGGQAVNIWAEVSFLLFSGIASIPNYGPLELRSNPFPIIKSPRLRFAGVGGF